MHLQNEIIITTIIVHSFTVCHQYQVMFEFGSLEVKFWRAAMAFLQNLPFVSWKAICHTSHFIQGRLFQAKSRFNCILCLKTKAAGSIWFKDKLDAKPIQKLLERFPLSYFMHPRPNIFINMQRSSWKFLPDGTIFNKMSPSNQKDIFSPSFLDVV